MNDMFGCRRLREVVTDARESLGGRAGRDELVSQVKRCLTLAEYENWAGAAFRQAVFASSKSRVAVDGEDAVYAVGGDISPLRLFTVEEFEAKARALARLANANRRAILDLAAVCERVHGSTFDAEAIIAEGGAA